MILRRSAATLLIASLLSSNAIGQQAASVVVTKDGVATSLCVKLSAAAAAQARGSVNAHDNQIQAFIHEVNAQRDGKAIGDGNANTLISLAGGL